MRKSAVIAIIFILSASFAGCGERASDADESHSAGRLSVAEVTKVLEDNIVTVQVNSEIEELEKGFSAVRYEGEDGFTAFLAGGGAKTDQEVVHFLVSEFFAENGSSLTMNTQVFGCSTLSVQNTEGGYLFGRNFDWNTCDALVVTSYPQEGYASVSTVNMGFIRQGTGISGGMLSDEMMTIAAVYAPLDGMNEKGLCISVNMIQDGTMISQNTDKPDITTTTAIRLLLNQAATVEEALDLLGQYDLHASMNYMVHFAIADAAGNSVAVEYIDNEMVVVETPVLTNFYLAEGEKQGIGTSQSHERFDILTEMIAERTSMTQAEVREALDSVSKDNFGEFESTEWSIVFDQSALTATYYHRENYEEAYFFQIKE
ncbi:MAG: C45 family autoproteolytic acyltransferase/hydrolase [Acetatifactor muris]|nr:C45 family autoproteolytic acyltransferase/hydrolase [Acetatifactor muris]